MSLERFGSLLTSGFESLYNIPNKYLDRYIYGSTGAVSFASFAEWITENTTLISIWIGAIIIPGGIRIWKAFEEHFDLKAARRERSELHRMELKRLALELEQQKTIFDNEQNSGTDRQNGGGGPIGR